MKDKKDIPQGAIRVLIEKLLKVIDSDSGREGLQETPARIEKFYREFLSNEDFKTTTFANEGYDEMVVQCNIPFYSLCEHHMVPFFGVAHVAYIPDERIVGLSKFSRIVDHFAHNLQNQERITTQVANYLHDTLDPAGVAVSLTARHLCMEMRGVRKCGAETTTTSLSGSFKSDPRTRNEFFQTINSQSSKHK